MKKFVYLAVFSISFSVLAFETVLTKFFNFKMLSSWAFLIVSIAFLGIGASGTYLYCRKRFTDAQQADFSLLANFSIGYTIFVPISIMLFAWFPFSPPQYLILQNALFSLFYIFLFSVPFFLSGVCISYILSLKEFPVGKVLFFDLIGAGTGCIACVLLLRPLGAYGVLIVSIACAYLTSMIFTYFLIKTQKKCTFTKVRIILPVILCLTLYSFPYLMVRLYKFDILATNRDQLHFNIFNEDFNGIESTYWNPITRIDLSKEGESNSWLYLLGLSKNYRNQKYTGRYILLDSGAAARQFRFDLNEADKEFFGHFTFSVPYHLKDKLDDVLIIGPGGGLEILIGKYFKVKHIDAVDINSDVIAILMGKNKNDKMSGIYSRFTLSDNDTQVKYYNDEGRSFVSKNVMSKYDIVQLTGVDLLSTLMSGGLVFSESYLYTQEALGYYYDVLKENGYLQICYWGGVHTLRLFITTLEMLKAKGVEHPAYSLAVIDEGYASSEFRNMTSLIIKKGLFSTDEMVKISQISDEDRFRVIFMPYMLENPRKYSGDYLETSTYILSSDTEGRKMVIEDSEFNLSPTHDDKPFFYSIRKPSYKLIPSTGFVPENGITVILTSLGTILAFVLILFPLIVRRISLNSNDKLSFGLLSFFATVGFAFSLAEVTILQKYAIFVGGPFYSMCITLPTLLIFYSLGAFYSAKIKIPVVRMLFISVGVIVLYGMLSYWLLDAVIKNFFYLSHLQRIILSVLLISPLGFFIGFPTPLVLEGIKGNIDAGIIPWMWGVNSSGNVLGALFFVPFSQVIGFNLLLLISCCLYLVATFFLFQRFKHLGYRVV